MSSTLLSFISIFLIEFLYVQGSSKFPDDLKPIHYKIRILTKLDELQFEGSVDILMKCYKETKTITLHSAELAINKEKISVMIADTSKKLKIINIEEVIEKQFLKICLLENLRNNTNYNVRINFLGVLKADARGFYINNYLDMENVLHTTANTQFEPTFARYAFPCFDLPHMKATFQVTIGRNRTLFSLNNMPLYKSEPIKGRNGWFWDRFRKTLPMSTYLVAFAVLDSSMEHMTYGKINIWIPPRSMLPKNIALEKATKLLNFLEKYFNIAYELPKLDILVVDNYISFAGGTENWGLITVANIAMQDLDFFPDRYVELMAHELVHQWIGNVVTMKCFGEIWLKEGITSYVTSIAKDVAFDGQTIDFDVAESFISVMHDNLAPALSVNNCPEETEDILMRYSSTTYEKGGLFTRMIGMTLGMKNLRKPLNLLLKKHKFGNIDENDLSTVLMESTPLGNFPCDLQMDAVLKSWTKQDGFPLVQVTRNFKSGTATLTQRKFYYVDPNVENTCWWIPISYTTKSNFRMNNPVAKRWMNCPKEPMTIRNLNSTDWILMNLQSTGLFIVKYDDDNWNLLTQTLRDRRTFEMIPYWNRFRLILDSIYLTYFGLSSHESLLTTLLYLKHETKHIVWKAALEYLNKIDWLEDDVVRLKNKYMKELVAPHFSRGLFDLREASLSAKLFRRDIITQACRYGDEECIEECLRLFDEYKKSFPTKTSLDPSIRMHVFCFAIKHGPEENAEFLRSIVSQVVDTLEVMHISLSLFCSGTQLLEPRMIEFWKREIGANDEYLALMKSSSRNNYGLPYIQSYMPPERLVLEAIGQNSLYSSIAVVYSLSMAADYIHETTKLDELKVIFDSLKDKLIRYKETIDESFRKIHRNIEWKKKYSKEIKAALSNILQAENIEDNCPTPSPSEKSQSYRLYSSIIYPIEICLCIMIVHSK